MSPDAAIALAWPGAGTGMLALAIVSVLAALLTIWAKPAVHRVREPEAARGVLVVLLVALAAVLAGALTGRWAAAGLMAVLTLITAGALARPLRRLTAAGLLMMVVAGVSLPVTAIWRSGMFVAQGFPA